ncbi:ygeX [Symbiodinium sp. KB8]|nr:ygeX [Symbiodinium sp. KB8]
MGGKRKSDAHAAGTADISAFCTGKKACVSTALVPACSAVSPADGPLVAVAKVLMETLEKDIATQILAPMMPEFEFWDAQAYVPLSKGGILPLSAELYREKIAVDRELTCMTTLREAIEHVDMLPLFGAIVNFHDRFFDREPENLRKWNTLISVRSESMPYPNEYEVLNGSIWRFAFLYGYARSLSLDTDDLRDRCRAAARSFPVKFQWATDSSLIRQRVQEDQNLKSARELAGLPIHRLSRVVVHIQKELKDAGKACKPEDIHKYLNEVKWSSADGKEFSKSGVASAVKIQGRLTEKSMRLLDAMESYAGNGKHPFSTLSALDVCCQKTNVRDSDLAGRLLEFCLEAIFVRLLRGNAKIQEGGREMVRTQCVVFLGIRRILHFLQEKLGFQCWLSFLAFHESQPRGTTLTHARDLVPDEGLPAAKLGSEKLCRESLAMLMDGAADEALEEALQGNPHMNAEDLLSTAALEGILMWKQIQELRAGEERERLLSAASAAASAAPSAVPAAAASSDVDAETGGPRRASEEVTVVEEEVAEVPKPSWTKFFPDLIIPDSMAETFSGRDETVLAKLHQFASARVQSTVTFCETPRTDMQHFLQHHAMLSSRNQDDRVVFVYDCKAHNDKFSERYPTWPFFLLPPLDESHLAKCLNAAVPEDRDMFVILDGRRLEAANKFKKAINKSPKWKGTASFMVRLCYDNQEFGSGGFASTRMRSSIGALPEPIETVMVLAGKSVELECTDRKYLNLPGNSFTRSFSGIHLRSSEEHNVRIPKSVMAAVQKDLSVQGDGSAAGSGAKADAASTAFGSEPDSEGLAWFPWTCEEGVYLEMLNFWARAQQTVIVSMTAGYGQLELACVRTQTQCVALTLNATHRQVLLQRLILVVMVQTLRGSTDFTGQRNMAVHPVQEPSETVAATAPPGPAAATPTAAPPAADMPEVDDSGADSSDGEGESEEESGSS